MKPPVQLCQSRWSAVVPCALFAFALFVPSLTQADVPAAQNSFDYDLAASQLLVDQAKVGYAIASSHTSTDPDDRAYSLPEEQALVAENADALKKLRAGMPYPYQSPQYRSFTATLPYLAKFRALAKLLELEGQVYSQQGDWAAAVNSDLDAVKFGEDIPHGSMIIGALVGMACQAIGRKHIWDALGHLNATQAKAAMTRLAAIQAGHFPLPETILVEKQVHIGGVKEILQDPRWKTHVDQVLIGELQPAGDTQTSDIVTSYWTPDKVAAMGGCTAQQVVSDEVAYWDAATQYVRQPYAADVPEPGLSGDPLSDFTHLDLKKMHMKAADTEVQNSLLVVALALRCYQQDHGAYPMALTSLVPSYLKQVPPDLFALSAPLHYRRTGDTYVLYSVGPDGQDNGGTPIHNSGADSTAAQYFVNVDSVGDVVAGINP